MVVPHRSLQRREIALLPRETLKDIQQLRRRVIQRVVELHFVRLSALRVLKGFLTEVCNPSVHIQIRALKIMQFPREIENSLHKRRVHLESDWVGLLVQLSNVIRCGAVLVHLDLYEFRITGLEDLAVRDSCSTIGSPRES